MEWKNRGRERGGQRGRGRGRWGKEKREEEGGEGAVEGGQKKVRETGVILHSSGVCLAKGGSGRAEDYGIMVSVVGHVSRRGLHWPCLPSLSKEA